MLETLKRTSLSADFMDKTAVLTGVASKTLRYTHDDRFPLVRPVDVSSASTPESFPTVLSLLPLLAASAAIVVVGVGLLVYIKKRSRGWHI